MPPGKSDNESYTRLLASPSWSDCERQIKAFEEAWRRGPAPAIEDYLRAEGEARQALLVELVHVDLEFRLKAGEPARAEAYLGRYPELAGDRDAALDLIAAEYELRRRTGPVDRDEYRHRFPRYQPDLLERLPAAPSGWPTIPGYELIRELGRGGMGVVYRARDRARGRDVALKLLPRESAGDPERLERFLREARAATALNDPHICTVYGLGEHEGRPFIVMELIEGRTLQELVGQRPGMTAVAALVAQAARALAVAHAAGVVHRDIKPENLMTAADGRVKVLDFGLARLMPTFAQPGPRGRGTAPGAILGTAAYMSPEQARGAPADSAADVFSLGIVLYELATGEHPFRANSALGIRQAIATRQPLPPSRLNPDVPAALEALITSMLHKDARQRPTAAAVAAALTGL